LLCDEEDVNLGFPIQFRAKTLSSVLEKVSSKKVTIKNSIKEIQDLAGLRIILVFKRDVSKIEKILEKNFFVVKKYNTRDRLESDQFGYESLHLVVKMLDDWLSVPTFKGFNDLLAEIQVRTLSQHTWAEASHIIHYKDLKSTPPELIRTISRASALLEIVDLEFERVLIEKETYRESIDEIIVEADSNTSLNVDILEKILDKMLPKKNKSGGEDYGEILDVLFKSEIKTIGQLTKMINAKKDAVIKEDQRITKYIIEHFNPKSLFGA
jgi:ppGpp synthetase/RelA/SpoT-type nucleotidyltranferase